MPTDDEPGNPVYNLRRESLPHMTSRRYIPIRPESAAIDVTQLARSLSAAVTGEVRFDKGTLAVYSADASNYRQVPLGVVIPKHAADIEAAMRICRAGNAPILPRGGGTSQNGQCVNVAVVIDCSKWGIRPLDWPATPYFLP